MKFTFPIFTLSTGGAQRTLVEITNGLVARGHEVIILMPFLGKIAYKLSARVKRIFSTNFTEKHFPNSDIIVSNYYTMAFAAKKAETQGKGLHIRLSLCYEPVFLPNNNVSFVTYQLTDKLLVCSKCQQQLIYLNHGIEGKIIPIGVSSVFHNLNQRHPEEDVVHIGAIVRRTVGSWSWHRDQSHLIEQLAWVKSQRPNVVLHLICPPSEFKKSSVLKQIIKKGDFVFHLPKTDEELCQFYNQIDIFVNSSLYDSISMPGLEAMKCGAALVTTCGGGNLDYCRHEENCLISYRYEDRLGYNIIRLVDDKILRKALAISGEQEASKWTWKRCLDNFEEAVQFFYNRDKRI